MLAPVVYAMIFIGIMLMVEGLYLVAFGKTLAREKKVNRRLALLQDGRDTEEVMSILRAEREGTMNAATMPVLGPLVVQARHANLLFTPTMLVVMTVGVIFICFVMLSLFTSTVLTLRILIALVMGYGTIYMWIRGKAKKRIALFEEQLPDALDLMVRSLRVGHPINAAVSIVSREMPDPIGTEFGLISDEATYGMPVNEALDRLAKRVPVPDLRFVAIAVNIQAQFGGNLAEILDGLSKVIRARFKLFRKVRAITAEARWSGWFLSVFPVIALLGVQVVDPAYYDRVSDHPLFLPGAIVTMVLLVVNIIFMRVLVNIKV